MKIEKYRYISNGKYEVVVDGKKYIIFEDIIVNNNILLKKEISFDELNGYLKENIFYEVYYDLVKYLDKKLRSKKEALDYLIKNNVSKDMIFKIIDRVSREGYINDLEFAKAYINDEVNLRFSGPLKIKNDLISKGINSFDIEDCLNIYAKDMMYEKINKYISKTIRLNNNKSSKILKNKILSYLMNKGFYKEDIIYCLNNYSFDDKDIYLKEYKKEYDKLSKKYSGDELLFKIKQKMFQKGFDVK